MLPGCIELLEVDDADVVEYPAARQVSQKVARVLSGRLPADPPRLDAPGPVVPGTAGLRVPSGYWTRLRIDSADMLLEHTWLSAEAADGVLFLRMRAAGTGRRTASPDLRAVIPLAIPGEGALERLVGVQLGKESLQGATITVRMPSGHLWYVDLERFIINEVSPEGVLGAFEGKARRGLKSDTLRHVSVGFMALRAPVSGQGSTSVPDPGA